MYPTFHHKLESIFDKIVFVPLEEKHDNLCSELLWLHYSCFNFKTKTWYPAPCLSGPLTPQGRPATATVSFSWEKLTLNAPIKRRPSLSLPPSSFCLPPCACACASTCSLASCRLLCHHHPRCPFFSSASTWPALVRGLGYGSRLLISRT